MVFNRTLTIDLEELTDQEERAIIHILKHARVRNAAQDLPPPPADQPEPSPEVKSYSLTNRYDTKGAANRLGLAAQTLCNYRLQSRGPVYHKMGKRIIYHEIDLREYETKKRIKPLSSRL